MSPGTLRKIAQLHWTYGNPPQGYGLESEEGQSPTYFSVSSLSQPDRERMLILNDNPFGFQDFSTFFQSCFELCRESAMKPAVCLYLIFLDKPE
jgi:hypothetical protein